MRPLLFRMFPLQNSFQHTETSRVDSILELQECETLETTFLFLLPLATTEDRIPLPLPAETLNISWSESAVAWELQQALADVLPRETGSFSLFLC